MFSWIPRRCIYASIAVTLAVFFALLASIPAFAVAPERPETLKPTEPVSATEAILHGVLDPDKEGSVGTYELGTYEFLYNEGSGTCAGGGRAPESPGISLGGGMEEVAQAVSGLQPNTHYTVCLLAREGIKGEETVGAAVTFKTALPPETPETKAANPIAATSAKLHGVLNPTNPGNAGSYEFLYRQSATECQGENPKATPTNASAGHEGEEATAEATELLPSTQYTFCLLARNETGETAIGPPETFSTLSASPTISGEIASGVGSTEAKLTVQIDPEGLPVSYRVEYGTSEAYGSSTPEVSIPAAQAAAGAEVQLGGLEPGTLYHYRFAATNSAHETTRDEEDQAFTTLATQPPGSGHCPNEAFRVGPSARLPDCRAYELVTPENVGNTQDMTFQGGDDKAIPSSDGEHLALQAGLTALGPAPGVAGTDAVFSRTGEGWRMTSAVAPGAGEEALFIRLLSPELSQVGLEAARKLNFVESSPITYEFGPVGGPYTPVASVPVGQSGEETYLAGANGGTDGVPPFSDVLLTSTDRKIPLASGMEQDAAEEALESATNVYDYSGGALRLVNVEGEGSHAKPLNKCGAALGAGEQAQGPGAAGAVSADGSRVFFTSPTQFGPCGEGGGESGPPRLYMRVDGRETVEVSKPARGVQLEPSERSEARYNAASRGGSEVFFNTTTPLTAGETPSEKSENKLFMYNTVTGALTRIASRFGALTGVVSGDEFVMVSEDGSTVYYEVSGNIYRYEVGSGKTSFVASYLNKASEGEEGYTTSNGEFLVFIAGYEGVRLAGPSGEPGGPIEPRGYGHNELYRYDALDGSVMCVSCGEGVVAPPTGLAFSPVAYASAGLTTEDQTPTMVQMSDDGQRVFFETTASLVPQDTNGGGKKLGPFGEALGALDVYEWEADGVEEEPGAVCRVVVGCTHLISTGEDVEDAHFLGASSNGDNIFFASAGQLVSQATPEYTNIYDARVDGGFQQPPSPPECSSCQGVGSPPPLFNAPASETFAGAGNPVAPPQPPAANTTKRTVKCRNGFRRGRKRDKCVRSQRKKARKANRGAGR